VSGQWGRTKNPRRDEERRRIAARLLDQGVPVGSPVGASLCPSGLFWPRYASRHRQTARKSDALAAQSRTKPAKIHGCSVENGVKWGHVSDWVPAG